MLFFYNIKMSNYLFVGNEHYKLSFEIYDGKFRLDPQEEKRLSSEALAIVAHLFTPLFKRQARNDVYCAYQVDFYLE